MRSAEPPLGACRPSLRLIDCTKQAGGKAGECALFAAEGEGVVGGLARGAHGQGVCPGSPGVFLRG